MNMKYPYNKKFMNDKDFESLLNEMCSVCGGGESEGLEMLMGNLAKIHEYSGEMMAMLSQNMEVEDWIEDKISKASQSMSDVKHYIEYKNSAYAAHSHAVEMHGGDVYMDQKMSVSGRPESRAEGDRMPVMSQIPAMTPQSSMQGGGCSAEVDDIGDMSDDMDMGMAGPDAEGMQSLPSEDMPLEPEEEEYDDEMEVLPLSEVWDAKRDREHPDYDPDEDEYDLSSDFPDEYDYEDDFRVHLQPKTLGDLQHDKDGFSGSDTMRHMAMNEPDLLLKQVKQLAGQKGMDPKDYLKSLGFDETHPVYKLLDSPLWDIETDPYEFIRNQGFPEIDEL